MAHRLVALALLLLTAAAPAAASAAVPSSAAQASDDLVAVNEALQAQQFDKARRRADALLKRSQPPKVRMLLHLARSLAFYAENKLADGAAALKASAAADPSAAEPLVLTIGFAPVTGDMGTAADALAKLIEAHPASVAEIEPEGAWAIIRWLDEQKRDKQADAIRIGMALHGPREGTALIQDFMAAAGAKAALRSELPAVAATLAAGVQSRSVLIEMLTDRAYAPLWPAIEAAAGDRLAGAESGAVDAARFAFEAEESIATRHSLMIALTAAGRLKEADRIGAGFRPSADELARLPQEAGWLINDHGLVLRADGRIEAADARIGQLTGMAIDERPWLINFLINRGTWQVRAGRFAEALAPVAAAKAQVERYGSGYAKQLVRRDELCARHGLDPAADTRALLDALKANERDSPEVLVEALHCLGRTAEGEAIVVRALEDERSRSRMIDALQPVAAERDLSPSIWRDAWPQLGARPAVAATFAKVGRALPERFWPAAR